MGLLTTCMVTITVAHINQYDDPDTNRAKMSINWFFAKTEQGAWLKEHMKKMTWSIEPDGGMEPHYLVEVECALEDVDATYYHIRWPRPYGLPSAD
jgi:hypothetical protein